MHFKVWPSLRFATFCVTKQLLSQVFIWTKFAVCRSNKFEWSQFLLSQNIITKQCAEFHHGSKPLPNISPTIHAKTDKCSNVLHLSRFHKRSLIRPILTQNRASSILSCSRSASIVGSLSKNALLCLEIRVYNILLLMHLRHCWTWHCCLICTFLVKKSVNAILLKYRTFVSKSIFRWPYTG